jgi:hypothetical protein
MHRVWHKRLLGPLFWLLGKAGILVARSGEEIPCQLKVRAGSLPTGEPYHRWERTFSFDPPVYFNTLVVYDKQLGLAVEASGPKNVLYMAWRAAFQPPRTLLLNTAAWGLRFGRYVLWLPNWLWPLVFGAVRFVQEADEARDDTVHIHMLITHPLFGKMFGYTGTFRTVRIETGAGAQELA